MIFLAHLLLGLHRLILKVVLLRVIYKHRQHDSQWPNSIKKGTMQSVMCLIMVSIQHCRSPSHCICWLCSPMCYFSFVILITYKQNWWCTNEQLKSRFFKFRLGMLEKESEKLREFHQKQECWISVYSVAVVIFKYTCIHVHVVCACYTLLFLLYNTMCFSVKLYWFKNEPANFSIFCWLRLVPAYQWALAPSVLLSVLSYSLIKINKLQVDKLLLKKLRSLLRLFVKQM